MNTESGAGLLQRWIAVYIKKGIDYGVRMKKPGGSEIQHNRRKQRDYSISII